MSGHHEDLNEEKREQLPLIRAFDAYSRGMSAIKTSQTGDEARAERLGHEAPNLDECYESWTAFHKWLAPEEQAVFENTLSGNQYSSYIVLTEFFAGAWHDESNPLESMRQQYQRVLTTAASEEEEGSHITYSKAVTVLFQHEMDWNNTGQIVISLSGVIAWRLEAVQKAAAQRIAYSCLSSCRLGSCLPANKPTQGHHTGSLLARPSLESPEGTVMPFYLWDIMRQRTVEVHKLASRPRYTCISHTWGRWERTDSIRLDGVDWDIPLNTRFQVEALPSLLQQAQLPTPYVWLDLVCIPQLGHDPVRQAEEIANQGAIFANAMACVAWLNDVRSWKRLYSAITWLGLSYLRFNSGLHFPDVENHMQKQFADADDSSDLFQKTIFPSSYPGVNRGEPQSTTSNATPEKLSFHSNNCCSRSVSECPVGVRLRSMSISGTSIGGISDFSAIFGFPDWLSSLWTLQEACLFPNMSLASSTFDYLQSPLGVHYTLDALILLRDSVKSWDTRSSKQLRACLPRHFGNSTPMDVILMGNERQCSSQRAPAIMSVLGFTDWYRAQIKSPNDTPGEGPLVLGKYPLPFVKEAAAKVGPLFFGSCPLDCTTHARGSAESMLPFFQGEEGYVTFPFVTTGARKDAEHERWRVTPEGSVIITSAVIIAASQTKIRNRDPVNTPATIFGHPSFEDSDADLQTVLDAIVAGSTEPRCAFAVHLSQDTEKQMGILLAGPIWQGTGTTLLAKFGAYEIEHSEEARYQILDRNEWPMLPKARTVDWIAV